MSSCSSVTRWRWASQRSCARSSMPRASAAVAGGAASGASRPIAVPCAGTSSHSGARFSPYMSMRCHSRQAMVVSGAGSGPGMAWSIAHRPSLRWRTDQQPGAGSQKYSSSVRPARRSRVRSQTSSDSNTSSVFPGTTRTVRLASNRRFGSLDQVDRAPQSGGGREPRTHDHQRASRSRRTASVALGNGARPPERLAGSASRSDCTSSIVMGSPLAGTTRRPPRSSRFPSVMASTRRPTPSAVISTSTSPGTRPRRSRSDFGIVSLPNLSMDARTRTTVQTQALNCCQNQPRRPVAARAARRPQGSR